MKQKLYANDVDMHRDIYKYEMATSKLIKNLLEEQKKYLLEPTLKNYKNYQKFKVETMKAFDVLEKEQDVLDELYRYIMFGDRNKNKIVKERIIN